MSSSMVSDRFHLLFFFLLRECSVFPIHNMIYFLNGGMMRFSTFFELVNVFRCGRRTRQVC